MTARERLRRRARYLWHDTDPAPVEVLTAAISVWFAAVLALGRSDHGPSPALVWALVAFSAASIKLAGVLGEWRMVRFAGCLLGTFFWVLLAVTLLYTVRVSLTWGGFVVIGCAQAWAVWRVMRP